MKNIMKDLVAFVFVVFCFSMSMNGQTANPGNTKIPLPKENTIQNNQASPDSTHMRNDSTRSRQRGNVDMRRDSVRTPRPDSVPALPDSVK